MSSVTRSPIGNLNFTRVMRIFLECKRKRETESERERERNDDVKR